MKSRKYDSHEIGFILIKKIESDLFAKAKRAKQFKPD